MSIRTQAFSVTGSTSADVYDDGISSVGGEAPKTLLRIVVTVSAWNGATVTAVEGQTTKQEAHDTNFRGYAAIASLTAGNTILVDGFQVNKQVKEGNPYRIGVKSNTTATSLRGFYEYEQADE